MAAAAIVSLNAALAAAQVIIQIRPNVAQDSPRSNTARDDDEIIRAVFDPITDDLKLTPEQRLQIVTIASATMMQAEDLFEQLDDIDAQLTVAAFSGQLDEIRIKQGSETQAGLLARIIAMKTRAKVNIYKVLTEEQRAMVVAQFPPAGTLGSISNFNR